MSLRCPICGKEPQFNLKVINKQISVSLGCRESFHTVEISEALGLGFSVSSQERTKEKLREEWGKLL